MTGKEAIEITGDRAEWELRRMYTALMLARVLNTIEEEKLLEAVCKRLGKEYTI